MGMDGAAKAGVCVVFTCNIVILGCSIAILAINRQELADVSYTCWYSWPYTSCYGYYWGCLASGNYNDTTPCNYLYAVGAIGIFISCLAMCFAPCPGGMIASIISGIFHIVWWAVAGWYFTEKYNDAKELPQNDYRHAIMGLCWTCLAFGSVQFLIAIAGTFKGRGRSDDYEEKEEKHHHKHEHKSHAEMTDQNPPPPLANPYPAPPPANPYPAPPPPANL